MNILIQEVTPSPDNYIAILGSKSHRARNGDLRVMAEGVSNFQYAGSSWVYERVVGSSEYFKTDGPLKENVTVYLLANSVYDGIRYTFSLPKTEIKALKEPVYIWKNESWGDCEADCAWGEQNRSIRCLRLGANNTEDEDYFLCDPLTKPESTQSCYTEPCVYTWAVTNWGNCDTVCGEGQEYREVTCEWTKRSGDVDIVSDGHCDADTKPAAVKTCLIKCIYNWLVSGWDECDVICGKGEQRRNVSCEWEKRNGNTEIIDDAFCRNESVKPDTVQACQLEDCVYTWAVSTWSSCTAECGEGEQQRNVHCEWLKRDTEREVVSDSYCDEDSKPDSIQSCNLEDCVYAWTVTDWESCIVTVCGDGQQERSITCEWVKNDGERMVVSDGFCSSDIKPNSHQACYVDCVYSWTATAWDTCSKACGVGEQRRNVQCVWEKGNREREVVSDSYCNGGIKPDSVQSCYLEDCVYNWTVTDWGSCNVSWCGDGQQKRKVSCEWLKKDNDKELVSDHFCSEELKPNSIQDCHVECVYSWTITNWNSCDVICGKGQQHREISCEWVKGDRITETVKDSYCNSDSKPNSIQQCQKEECTYVWSSKQWGECDVDCGEGWKRREVVCLWVNLFNISSYTESEAVVSDDFCLSSFTKPEEITVCQAPKACIVYHWEISEWAEVSTLLY